MEYRGRFRNGFLGELSKVASRGHRMFTGERSESDWMKELTQDSYMYNDGDIIECESDNGKFVFKIVDGKPVRFMNESEASQKRNEKKIVAGKAYGQLKDMDDYPDEERQTYIEIAEDLEDMYSDVENTIGINGRPNGDNVGKVVNMMKDKINGYDLKSIPAPVYLWIENDNFHMLNEILVHLDKFEPSMKGEYVSDEVKNSSDKKASEDMKEYTPYQLALDKARTLGQSLSLMSEDRAERQIEIFMDRIDNDFIDKHLYTQEEYNGIIKELNKAYKTASNDKFKEGDEIITTVEITDQFAKDAKLPKGSQGTVHQKNNAGNYDVQFNINGEWQTWKVKGSQMKKKGSDKESGQDMPDMIDSQTGRGQGTPDGEGKAVATTSDKNKIEAEVGDTYKVVGEFELTFGADTQNPSGNGIKTISVGSTVKFVDQASDGTTWFEYEGERGKYSGNGWCPSLERSLEKVSDIRDSYKDIVDKAHGEEFYNKIINDIKSKLPNLIEDEVKDIVEALRKSQKEIDEFEIDVRKNDTNNMDSKEGGYNEDGSYQVKFETLKKKAKDEAYNLIKGHSGWKTDAWFYALQESIGETKRKPSEVVDEWAKEADSMIDRWDVRMVKKLIEIFPRIVPTKFKDATPTADMDENGDWMVYFTSKQASNNATNNDKVVNSNAQVVDKSANNKDIVEETNNMEKKAEENYNQMAQDDAKMFINNYEESIIEQLLDKGEASDDLWNDYDNGDSFIHESYTDKWYNIKESAEILEQLNEYEETDSGLWEGQAPREAISTQAAYTYSSAVIEFIRGYIKNINDEWSEAGSPAGEDAEGTNRSVAEQIVKKYE